MNCEEIQENLSALDDGELEPGEKAEIEAHLADCESCRKKRAETRAVWSLLGVIPDREPPAGFHGKILDRVRERRIAATRKRAALQAVAALAASVLLLLGLMFMGRREITEPGKEGEHGVTPRETAVAFSEVEEAVKEDPDLLEILNHLDALDEIEFLESLPLLENMDEIQVRAADDLAEAAEILLLDPEVPLEPGERD